MYVLQLIDFFIYLKVGTRIEIHIETQGRSLKMNSLKSLGMDNMSNSVSSTADFTKYIRITGPRDAKFVEFDFAIGDPTLFVELVLPQQAFLAFCQNNQVIEMTEQQQQMNDALEDQWRYGIEPTMVRQARQHSDQDDQH